MLASVCPKLPMRNRVITLDYFVNQLGFKYMGNDEFEDYLIVQKDNVELHFFSFKELNPDENYGQVYIRTMEIDKLYQLFLDNGVVIHPNGHLAIKPWMQKEFSLLDPDNNLLTFGQAV